MIIVFFVEENCVSTEINIIDDSIDFIEVDGDGDLNDIFEQYQDEINDSTMIIVTE